MKTIVLLVAVICVVTKIEGRPQRSRNPDIDVLRDFVAELREAGRIRDVRVPRDSDENSSSEEHKRYRPIRVRVYSSTTTPNPNGQVSSTDKSILKYSPVANKAQSTSYSSTTPYPQGTSTYKYRPPYNIERVNDGVSTILRGVGSARLSEILRGSFMFTRNENVRSVANSVIDSIFGPRDPSLGRNKNYGDGVFPLTAF